MARHAQLTSRHLCQTCNVVFHTLFPIRLYYLGRGQNCHSIARTLSSCDGAELPTHSIVEGTRTAAEVSKNLRGTWSSSQAHTRIIQIAAPRPLLGRRQRPRWLRGRRFQHHVRRVCSVHTCTTTRLRLYDDDG